MTTGALIKKLTTVWLVDGICRRTNMYLHLEPVITSTTLPYPCQRPKKSELLEWQFQCAKNFLDEVRKFFSQQNSVQILFATKIHKTICNLMSTKSKECMFFSVTFPPSHHPKFLKTVWKITSQ